MFDAGVGQHALGVPGVQQEEGRHGHAQQAEAHQDLLGERGLAGAGADLDGAQDAQEGAVQERPREQGRDHAGGLAVGVGKPGVQGDQTHLGPIAHHQQDEGQAQPVRVQLGPVGQAVQPQDLGAARSPTGRRQHQEEVAQQRQADPHRADQQVLPGSLQRAPMAMEVDQRSRSQGGGLDGHPQKGQMAAGADQRHAGQEEQQTPHEDRLLGVGEGVLAPHVGLHAGRLVAQVADGIDRRGQEDQAGDAQEDPPQGIQAQPASSGRIVPGQHAEQEVHGPHGGQKTAHPGPGRQPEGDQTGQGGQQAEKRNQHPNLSTPPSPGYPAWRRRAGCGRW